MFPKPESVNDYKDALRSTADRPDVILELPVRSEVKKDKLENRLLVLTQYRLYILTPSKPPYKVENSYNILDITYIESSSKTSLKLGFLADSKPHSFHTPHSSTTSDGSPGHLANYDFDSFLAAFVYAFRLTFPEASRRPLPTITTTPSSRIESIVAVYGCVSAPNAASTFSAAYRCSCDRLNAEYKPFVAWDVDTIFWMHEDREMALSEFEQGPVDTLLPKDYLPLFAALQYDTWFTSLNLSHSKLNLDLIAELCNVLATNRSLTDLRMASITGRSMNEILSKIQTTLERSHGGNCLSLLDFSGNSFDDKAVAALGMIAGCLASRLSYLSLARCSLSSRQVAQLTDVPGLRGAGMAGNLTHLDLSGNSCKSDETSVMLCNLISSSPAIRHLNLNSTDINLQHLGNALIVGPCSSLAFLDLNQNSWAFRQHPVANGSQLVKFFQLATSLKRLSLSENRLSNDFLLSAFASFSTNTSLNELELDLSGNDLQKTSCGVNAIVDSIHACSCIFSMNFADNGLDADFSKLIDGCSRCPNLQKLSFAKNIPSAKYRSGIAETLANILQSADVRWRCLDISDCKLRQSCSTICAALTDSRLTEMDMSGNQMGDSGVVYLSKALQGNTRLRKLTIDRNHVSLTGYQALASALLKNFTLTSLPTPISDIAQIVTSKTSLTEKCTNIFNKVETLIARNRETSNVLAGSRTVAKQVFRFQTGCSVSESLEALWQTYGEVEYIFLSIQPPGAVLPSVEEEPLLNEAADVLSIVREIMKKLSNMTYPLPDISSSEKIFSGILEDVAKQSFQPVVDHLAQAVEMLSTRGHSLLPVSALEVRHLLEQMAQGCSSDCYRETSRAMASACYACHYASLFRVLETITTGVRERLRACRALLLERAAKGRSKPALGATVSTPSSIAANVQQASKYGTLNRRQRPVSMKTPEHFPTFSDDTPEESQLNQIYGLVATQASQKSGSGRRPMAAELFETPPPPPPLHNPVLSSATVNGNSPEVQQPALLSNPCKGRPRKPKSQRPTRPVVQDVSNGLSNDNNAPLRTATPPNDHHNCDPLNHHKPASPTPHRRSNPSPATPSSNTKIRERSNSNSGDELSKGDHPVLAKTSLNKAVIGGVKVGPSVNLGDVKLRRRVNDSTEHNNSLDLQSNGQQQPTTPLNENSNAATVLPSSLKRLVAEDANNHQAHSAENTSTAPVVKPKPPVKPAKPPKMVGSAALPGQTATSGPASNGIIKPLAKVSPGVMSASENLTSATSSNNTNNSGNDNQNGSNNRPPSPPSFSDPDAFQDRMSRFGGGAKFRRDQVRSMYVGDPPSMPNKPVVALKPTSTGHDNNKSSDTDALSSTR